MVGVANPEPMASTPAAAAAAAAAAGSAAPTKLGQSSETLTKVRAFGACWSLEQAYSGLSKAGCCAKQWPPVYVEADAGLNPSDLTVLGARAAVSSGARSAVAVQQTRKRGADGAAGTVVGWVVI